MESSAGTLTLIGTPIGNLGDISSRALEALSSCDFIAAEDTRVTIKLLNRFDIKKPLVSYYQHNTALSGEKIISRLESGESCCLVSDAGMPAISDPGELLVKECAERGISVGCVPGPTALITALCLSGLNTGRFCFEGFLSVSKKKRREHLEAIKDETRTLVFYEAPHKLLKTLRDLFETLGERKVSLCRELTKIHEEIVRTTLSEALKSAREKDPIGEYVLIIEGAQPAAPKEITIEEAVEMALELTGQGLSKTEAAKRASAETGYKKSEIYAYIAK